MTGLSNGPVKGFHLPDPNEPFKNYLVQPKTETEKGSAPTHPTKAGTRPVHHPNALAR